MKGEFLLEIGCEEIPAGFIPPALESLKDLFTKSLAGARLGHGTIETYATPRRLIVRIPNVPESQESVEIEKTGPAKAAAYDAEGNPSKAAIGFAKSQGVDVSDLFLVSTAKGEQVAVRKLEKGKPTTDVFSEIVPSIMEKITFPKTMRWMDLDSRFARPLHWIVAIFSDAVVPFEYGGIKSGNETRGHRFTHPGPIRVSSFQELTTSLEQAGVIIDPAVRREAVQTKLAQIAEENGFKPFEDSGLLEEVTYIVESPYPIMGQFAQDFLELPASILITCMKKHQRYFSVQGRDGRITNRFIAVNNTPVKDPDFSIKGHERVIKARLEDARFYFREDRKHPLLDRLDSLKGVVFHSKLGTAYEKVERFTALAVSLAQQIAPEKTEAVRRAALLSKCDLETGIVYEFPELQGVIGSFYARMDGEPDEISVAIREHYMPNFAGDNLPEGIIGSIISVADRVDTIVGCFSVGLIPTGAADPYALRRHALGVIQILMNLGNAINLRDLVQESGKLLASKRTRDSDQVINDVMEFIRTRFINFHVTRGFDLDVTEAVVRSGFDDLVDSRKRLEALQEWKQRQDFDSIMVGFKRVVNILKGHSPGEVHPNRFTEDPEHQLYSTLLDVVQRTKSSRAEGNYLDTLEIIAELRPSIDTFFDKVMVMVEDEKLRQNRLALLNEVAVLFSGIADFSFIGSTA